MNADGKMDKKEFSIACHLISAKLKGLELPKSLPTSLKADPVPSLGSFGAPPMPSSGAIVMGTMPAMTSQPMMGMGKHWFQFHFIRYLNMTLHSVVYIIHVLQTFVFLIVLLLYF